MPFVRLTHWTRGIRGTTFGAIAVAVVLVLAVLGLGAQIVWQNYQAAIMAGQTRAQSSADIVAAHSEWMISAGDQALRRIDEALGPLAISNSPDQVDNISQAVGNLPAGFQYAVYDWTGQLRFSSIEKPISINDGDRLYFQRLKRGERFVISHQFKEQTTGKTVFVVAKSILRQGEFRGAAVIIIPSAKMDEFWNSIGLGGDSTVSLVRTDGEVVARHPALDQPLNVGKSRIFELSAKADHGVYISNASPADGKARIVGFRKVANWPLIATAGIERNEALEIFWSLLRSQTYIALPIVILLFGCIILNIVMIRTLTRRNTALEVALERNHFLFREIHHRVKNNLQAVNSLIRLSALPRDQKSEMASRIAAMVAVHEHIYGSDQFDRVEIAAYAEKLIRDVAESHPGAIVITADLEPLTVDRDAALPFGMVLNEILSNAFKYAFAGRAGGKLDVTLARQDNDQACLTVRDDGPGFSTDAVEKGMGSRLIEGFVSQLGGHYEFISDNGTVFRMTFPAQ